MQDSQKRNGMIAAGLLLGAAAIYTAVRILKRDHGKSQEQNTISIQEKTTTVPEVQQEQPPLSLRELLEREDLLKVKMTENKYCLHPDYLIQLINFIAIVAQSRDKAAVAQLRAKRLELFEQEAWHDYNDVVMETFKSETRMQTVLTKEVLAEVHLCQQDLDKAEQMLITTNAQMFNVLESCRMGWYPLNSNKGKPPSITKEEALRVIRVALPFDEKAREASRSLKKQAQLGGDIQAQANYFFSDLANKQRANDTLLKQTGVERSELEKAIKQYYQEDREFALEFGNVVRECVLATKDDKVDQVANVTL